MNQASGLNGLSGCSVFGCNGCVVEPSGLTLIVTTCTRPDVFPFIVTVVVAAVFIDCVLSDTDSAIAVELDVPPNLTIFVFSIIKV